MKYLWGEKFTIPMGGDATYRANWDAIFTREQVLGHTDALAEESTRLFSDDAPATEPAPARAPLPGDDCPCESGKAFARCHGREE